MISYQVRHQINDRVKDQLEYFWNQVHGQIETQVNKELSGKIWAEVGGHVWVPSRGHVMINVRNQIGSQLK